jgi:hypothetical protein
VGVVGFVFMTFMGLRQQLIGKATEQYNTKPAKIVPLGTYS